ncbi:DUF1376 domain-containing protein [Microvirga mediterraneensis]|uniref:DUF1376 domain-containing protein n=1 Tax=Microvirga mediterraneensis TaxID=2754695 RepID=A0A838BMM0_9HYPH|nr:DUF1376 domain-containing protein [Microvirga mediterraneensis]MBA1156914.1 DUF1376 domain-containing protein [Microvirga mediterraneensis]
MSTSKMPWFKCRPDPFLSALAEMDADCQHLYTVVILKIYARGGPIRADVKALATFCRRSVRTVQAALDRLVEMGRLTLSDGQISNPAAERELADRDSVSNSRSQNGKLGGEMSGISRKEKAQHNQQRPEANASDSGSKTKQERSDKDKEEEKKEESARTGAQMPQNMQARMLAELPPGVDWPIRISVKLQPIFECLEAGADFEKHVLPVIHEEAKNAHAAGRKLSSWENVVPQIMAAVEREKRPSPTKADTGFTDEMWDRALEGWKRTKYWPYGKWSLAPDMPGCKVPAHILAAHGCGRVAA